MIRFIVEKTCTYDSSVYQAIKTFVTLDVQCKELENLLSTGGFSQHGCELYKLVGCEVIKDQEAHEQG